MERDMRWRTISSEQLFQETWMKIRVDTCEKPDGNIVTPYYVYQFPNWVAAVAITKEGNVILERQYRHALGQTDMELPGGCVDESDASFEAAIARELLEETGYRFDHYEYLGITSSNPSTHDNLMHMFLATGGEKLGEQQLDPGEDIEIHLVSMDTFIEMFKNNAFIQSMHVTTIFRALKKMGRLVIH